MRNLCGPGDEDDDDEVTQLVELGEVSTDTHGLPWGHNFDGGLGWKFP